MAFSQIEEQLSQKLAQRTATGHLRSLSLSEGRIDFCSNDYLGLARSKTLQNLLAEITGNAPPNHGAGSARLISGNHAFTESLESDIAHFHGAESGLLFNSGYTANLGLFSSLAGKADTIITDQLVHASIIDGVRLSKAQRLIFRHNDLEDLEVKLQQARGNVFVGIEALYSMDGDFAPLVAISTLCQQYGAALIVDEAHSNGVIGPAGSGMVSALGLEKEVFARIHTFGKALGTHGAIILGSPTLRSYLTNFARSFIYTTAAPLHQWFAVSAAYETLPHLEKERAQLMRLITHFQTEMYPLPWTVLESTSWIQGILVPGNRAVRAVAKQLQTAGFGVKPIVSPTVPEGQERIRICLHSFNTVSQIKALAAKLLEASQRLCKDTLLPA